MTDYTTIRVTKDAKDAAGESKREDETWNDYIRRCTDNPPEVTEFVDAGRVGVDEAKIASAVLSDMRGELPEAVADAVEARLR